MAHPIRTGSRINLAELREFLRPGIEQMIDDMYKSNPGQWENVFESRGL
jgi:hypothetical protein